MAGDLVQHNRNVFNIAKWPLLLYGILAALYVYQSKFTLFSWHPFFMTVSFIALAGNAALIKKIGGYENTKAHGTLMFLAMAAAGAGWYVIHTNKNILGKLHLQSLHGKFGAAVLLSYFGLGVAGAVFLNPDFGIAKTNKTIRFAHKIGGRLTIAAAWAAAVFGVTQIQSDIKIQLGFGLPLLLLGFFVLL